jgi:hypothetical protein
MMYTSPHIDVLPLLKERASVLNLHLSGCTEHFGIYLHKNQQVHQNYHFIVEHGPWARPLGTALGHGPCTRPLGTALWHGP